MSLPRMPKRPVAVGFLAVAAALAAAVGYDWMRALPPTAMSEARYVGRASCIACHQAEAAAFAGSDHDRAMELATAESVLGDFNDAIFTRQGETTRFFRDGSRYMVNAEGPDGVNHDYEVKWTFGVDPLQQYMVEFPDGRVQVLRVSWDVRKKRWFYVAPPDAENERLEPSDPLHWTGLAQNWNTMCAECHSTHYHKNFDLATNGYDSKFFEIDVSCEACHGPGSVHVQLAERRSLFWDRRVRYGLANPLKDVANSREVETCAPCHSRRSVVGDGYHAGREFLDFHQPLLLATGLYHADGQILDEVYEYGSFTQSKMHRKGVRCTDCHNPHSLSLRYEGNRLCAQCHQPGKFDTAAHHHHPSAAAGAAETQCVTCHMPTRVYMGIDERHDHSLQIPRPDLSAAVDAPNACNRCHQKPEEDARWAAAKIAEWFGPERPDDPQYAIPLMAARRGDADAPQLIAELLERTDVPDIVRATAVDLLTPYDSPLSVRLRREALDHPSALVRAAAARSAAPASTANLIRDVAPLLNDAIRSVRTAAATRLVAAASELASTQFRGALDQAIAEFRAGQALHLDRADAHMSLATLNLDLGDPPAAIAALRHAIRQEPYRSGPRSELARLLAAVASDPAQARLAAELNASDEEIRRLRSQEADLLARDADLLPGDPLPHYQRGMLLYLLDQLDEARLALEEACRVGPEDYRNWTALALICEKQKRWEDAARAVKRMSEMRPDADDWKGILLRMKGTIEAEQSRRARDAAAEAPHSESQSPAETRPASPSPADVETPPAAGAGGSPVPESRD